MGRFKGEKNEGQLAGFSFVFLLFDTLFISVFHVFFGFGMVLTYSISASFRFERLLVVLAILGILESGCCLPILQLSEKIKNI